MLQIQRAPQYSQITIYLDVRQTDKQVTTTAMVNPSSARPNDRELANHVIRPTLYVRSVPSRYECRSKTDRPTYRPTHGISIFAGPAQLSRRNALAAV